MTKACPDVFFKPHKRYSFCFCDFFIFYMLLYGENGCIFLSIHIRIPVLVAVALLFILVSLMVNLFAFFHSQFVLLFFFSSKRI